MESSEKSQFGRPIAHTSEFATCSRTVRRQESFASGSDEDEERSLKLALVDNPIKIGRVEDSNSITCGNWKKRAMLRSAEWSDAQSATCGDNVLCKVEPDAPPTPSAAASMLTGPVAVETTVVRRHRRKPPAGVRLTCRVCGDDACGYNFDALTCHSCKLFFRRNAYRVSLLPRNYLLFYKLLSTLALSSFSPKYKRSSFSSFLNATFTVGNLAFTYILLCNESYDVNILFESDSLQWRRMQSGRNCVFFQKTPNVLNAVLLVAKTRK